MNKSQTAFQFSVETLAKNNLFYRRSIEEGWEWGCGPDRKVYEACSSRDVFGEAAKVSPSSA